MKANYPVWYLLLFLVMITGTLASMALNGYGMKLMGLGCVGFALAFLHELVIHRDRKPARLAELALLAILCALLACRNFYVEIPAGQTVSAFLFALLALLYVYHGIRLVRKYGKTSRPAMVGLLAYYGAVVSFLTGLVSGLISISPDYGTAAGILFLILFAATHFASRQVYIGGESTTVGQLCVGAKNKSVVVLSALLITGFLFTLIQYQVLPPLYAGDMPVGYTRLVQRAESGLDPMAAKGQPRHRAFREAYQRFIERQK